MQWNMRYLNRVLLSMSFILLTGRTEPPSRRLENQPPRPPPPPLSTLQVCGGRISLFAHLKTHQDPRRTITGLSGITNEESSFGKKVLILP
jgi:hypothetical protein